MNISRYTIVITIAIALFTSSAAMAETVKKGLVACVSEEILKEAITYATKRDKSGFTQLLTSGQCTTLTEGEQVSVISSGFVTTTIRYQGVKLYTPSEAVR